MTIQLHVDVGFTVGVGAGDGVGGTNVRGNWFVDSCYSHVDAIYNRVYLMIAICFCAMYSIAARFTKYILTFNTKYFS